MDSQKQEDFLNAVAGYCQFNVGNKEVFKVRFNRENYGKDTSKIKEIIKLGIDKVQQNDIPIICTAIAGIPKRQKPGRPPIKANESPWKTAYDYLWNTVYPVWENGQKDEWKKYIGILSTPASLTANVIATDNANIPLDQVNFKSLPAENSASSIIEPPPPQSVNPFIPRNGIIDNPQLFFPRAREIRNIFEVLNSGSSVALIGQSAIGKSSLLMEICQQAPNKLTTPRQPIYLELNGCRSENQVYRRLANKIGIEITNGDLYSALQNHKLLLALDNVECQGFTRSVRDCLRSLAEGSQSPLKLVIAATKFLDELFNDSQDGGTSPLAGICQSEVLKPWNEAIIRKFIDSRLKAPWLKPVTNPVSFTEEEIARLIAESGGHPQKLMQLCYQTYSGYLEEMR